MSSAGISWSQAPIETGREHSVSDPEPAASTHFPTKIVDSLCTFCEAQKSTCAYCFITGSLNSTEFEDRASKFAQNVIESIYGSPHSTPTQIGWDAVDEMETDEIEADKLSASSAAAFHNVPQISLGPEVVAEKPKTDSKRPIPKFRFYEVSADEAKKGKKQSDPSIGFARPKGQEVHFSTPLSQVKKV